MAGGGAAARWAAAGPRLMPRRSMLDVSASLTAALQTWWATIRNRRTRPQYQACWSAGGPPPSPMINNPLTSSFSLVP